MASPEVNGNANKIWIFISGLNVLFAFLRTVTSAISKAFSKEQATAKSEMFNVKDDDHLPIMDTNSNVSERIGFDGCIAKSNGVYLKHRPKSVIKECFSEQISDLVTSDANSGQYELNSDSRNEGTAINKRENFTEVCEPTEINCIDNPQPEMDMPKQESISNYLDPVLNVSEKTDSDSSNTISNGVYLETFINGQHADLEVSGLIGSERCCSANGVYLEPCSKSVIKEHFAEQVSDSDTSDESTGQYEPSNDSGNEHSVINRQQDNFMELCDNTEKECRDNPQSKMDMPKQETFINELRADLEVSGLIGSESCSLANGVFLEPCPKLVVKEHCAEQVSDSDTSGANTGQHEPSNDRGNEHNVINRQQDNFTGLCDNSEKECRDKSQLEMDVPKQETFINELRADLEVSGSIGSKSCSLANGVFLEPCPKSVVKEHCAEQVSDSDTSGVNTGQYEPSNKSGNEHNVINKQKENFMELCDTTEKECSNIVKTEIDVLKQEKNFMESSDAIEDECLDGSQLMKSFLTLFGFNILYKPNQHNDNEQRNVYNHGKYAFRLSDVFEGICRAVCMLEKVICKLSCILWMIKLIFAFLPTADCHLVETPSNTAVINGSPQVLFKCRSGEALGLNWFVRNYTMSEQKVLYQYDKTPSEAASFWRVENVEPGRFDLRLTTIREAAQTYTCREPDTNNEFSADLIILRETRFEMKVVDGLVFIKCIVEFRGNWAPELEWSHNGESITKGLFVSTVPNTRVYSSLVLPLSTVERKYTCTTKFNIKGKPQNTTSTNVPNYQSNSVLTVEASQEFSDAYKSQTRVNGILMILVIGLALIGMVVCAGGIAAGIYMC